MVWSTSRIRPGVENTSDGRCVGVGVAHDQRGEGVVLHLAEQMQAVEALQIVEAVAVLQLLHLDFEDEVEGRAEHAAERHDLLGQAADPEIDVVEAAERAVRRRRRVPLRKLRVASVGTVECRRTTAPVDDRQRRVALALDRRLRW